MICMKEVRFSSRLSAKVRYQGPPGSARAQPCRMENEKFRFVIIQFQFVSSHPVSDIDKTAFNPGNCSGKINAIITTEGVYS